MKHRYFFYILTNKKYGVLYIGVTNSIPRRGMEHKEGLQESFSKRYRTTQLVYAEEFRYIDKALEREKCLKRWKREWKIELIENANPGWKDLYETLNEWL